MNKHGSLKNPVDTRDFQHKDIYIAGEINPNASIIDSTIPRLTMMDQDPFGDCPFYDTVRLMKAWWFDKGKGEIDLSPRFLVILGKQLDNIPTSQGTFPRVPMGIAVNNGCCTQALLPDDKTLTWEEYSNPKAITPEMMTEALKYKIPAYVTIPADLASLRQALTQYKRIGITLPVGDFSTSTLKPPLPTAQNELHRITLYGDVPQPQSKEIDLIANQWGTYWGNKGYGAFNFTDFGGMIYDVMAFTEATPSLLKSINKMNYLKIHSLGPDVITLQNELIKAGYNIIADGNFGPKTDAAVRDFQTQNGLTADGIVGPNTLAKLAPYASGDNLDNLLKATIIIESGGDDNAVGDHGNAFGCLQLWQGNIDEVNNKLGTSYKAHDTLGNRSLSILIWNTYWSIHTEMITNQDKAFCWNGGAGWRSRYGKPEWSTYSNNLDKYWNLIQKHL